MGDARSDEHRPHAVRRLRPYHIRRAFCDVVCVNTFEQFQGSYENVIVEAYQAGRSISELSRLFEVSRRWVDRILKANDIAIRTGKLPGTKIKTSSGYVQVVLATDSPYRPMCSYHSYVLEHRLVMAEHLERLLTPDETVHHINGDRTDNRIENLQLCKGRHGNGMTMRCRCCGSEDVEFAELAVK